ncbi:hypothetical protein B0H10DRAFT_759848 [Mycena sp. CBHHK59/15]|nr:hypothetical protein B0H10DRAFT_759848 [Mycena sp. CBHHK59/15]
MAETTLQARIGPYPSANLSPKKAWKKQKPYIDNHQQATAWQHTKKPYHRDDGHRPSAHALPSLFDRLGLPPPAQPRSLLERIEVDGAMDHMEVVKTDVVHSSDRAFIPSEAAQPGKMDIEEDGEVQDEVPRRCDSDQEDGEVRTGGQPRKRPVPTSFLWNGFSPAIANPPSRVPPILTITSTGENNSDVCQSKSNSGHAINPTSEAAVADSLLPDSENDSFVAARKVPESQVNTNHFNVYDGDMVMPLAQPESLSHLDASRVQNRLPLQERVSRALRSIVFENAKMRETKGTVDWNKAQSKIDKLVTGPVSESFLAQMKKVREEMDARRAGPKIDETMARAKDDLSIGFGGKGGPGGHSDNTWLTKGATATLFSLRSRRHLSSQHLLLPLTQKAWPRILRQRPER